MLSFFYVCDKLVRASVRAGYGYTFVTATLFGKCVRVFFCALSQLVRASVRIGYGLLKCSTDFQIAKIAQFIIRQLFKWCALYCISSKCCNSLTRSDPVTRNVPCHTRNSLKSLLKIVIIATTVIPDTNEKRAVTYIQITRSLTFI